MLFSITAFALADDDNTCVNTFEIYSPKDLKKLAEMCRLDTSSENLVVNLKRDIMVDSDFTPIPIFSGTFNGNGHLITGLDIHGKYSYSGLFSILTPSAVVSNLTVQGTIAPSGDTTSAGGIAGVNNGTIESCNFYGTVKGLNNVAGIAGDNQGIISKCTNYGDINTDYKDGKLTVRDIKQLQLSEVTGIFTLKAAENVGGVAGNNDGTIYSCSNYGSVGTEGNGYKVGGIVGYNTGYITLSSNFASISGKTKVGGIAGQSAPFLKTEYSKDYLSPIKSDVDDIVEILEDLTYEIDGDTDILTRSIVNITNIISNASGHANTLTSNIYDFGNETIGEVNEIMTFVTTATTGLQSVTGDIRNVSSGVNSGMSDAKSAIAEIKSSGKVTAEALSYITSTITNFSSAAEYINSATVDVENMVTSMNQVKPSGFSTMSTEIKASMTSLTGDVRQLSSEVQSLSLQLNGAEKDLTTDVRGISTDVKSLVNNVTDIAYSLHDLKVSSIVKDKSDDHIISATDSKDGIIENCQNTGCISAKDNAGGVVGLMGFSTDVSIDSGVEPESYTVKTLSYRAIISYSRNYGYVTTENNYSGSICGHESAGAIVNCQGYGCIISENGEYVGGITGRASGLVRDCFSKVILSGNDYVAGIAGDGTEKTLLGGKSSIYENIADATVISDTQHKGGISGSDKGSYAWNYFLAGELNGMETCSKEFEAAPISKETLISIEGLPDEFTMGAQNLLAKATFTNQESSKSDICITAFITAVTITIITLCVVIALVKSKKENDGATTQSAVKEEPIQQWK